MCPRKWAHRYLDGRVSESNKYAALGTEVHDQQIAPWFLERRIPDVSRAGKIAAKIIWHLPAPQRGGLVVEKEIRLMVGAARFVGRVDLWDPVGPPPTVYDHKTTSDLKWAKTPDDLVVDVQATLYAAWALEETGSDLVKLQWTYGTTGGRPRGQPVVREVTGVDLAPRLEKTAAAAEEMLALKLRGARAAEVVADASACGAYGGCPYRDVCVLSEEEKMRSFVGQEQARAKFTEKLKVFTESRGAAAGATGINPPDGAGAPAAPTPTVDFSALRNRLAARQTASEPTPAAPPPSLPPPPTTVVSTPPAEVTTVEEGAAVPTVEEMVEGMEKGMEMVFEATEKRGRGRPKGSKNKPRQESSSSSPSSVPSTLDGYVLYVDCAPVKLRAGDSQPEHASERIDRVLHRYDEVHGISHYKLGQGEELGFGRGAAIFAEMIASDLAEDPPEGAVVLHTASPEARDCYQAFAAGAHTIVHG
jgi:hypothetical protein